MAENKNRLRVKTPEVVLNDEVEEVEKKPAGKPVKSVDKPVRKKTSRKPESKVARRRKESDGRGRICFGILFFLIGVFLLIAFANPYLGYTPNGKWLNNLGIFMSQKMFGLGTVYLIFLVALLGLHLMWKKIYIKPWALWKYSLVFLLWIPIFIALILDNSIYDNQKFYGLVGYKCYDYIKHYLDMAGVILLLVLTALVFVVFTFDIKFDFLKKKEVNLVADNDDEEDDDDDDDDTKDDDDNGTSTNEKPNEIDLSDDFDDDSDVNENDEDDDDDIQIEIINKHEKTDNSSVKPDEPSVKSGNVEMEVTEQTEEKQLRE